MCPPPNPRPVQNQYIVVSPILNLGAPLFVVLVYVELIQTLDSGHLFRFTYRYVYIYQ